MATYTVKIHYRAENRRNPWLPILAGYRGEVFGLPNGLMVYTGVCESREVVIADLVGQLKARGLSGKLRVVR